LVIPPQGGAEQVRVPPIGIGIHAKGGIDVHANYECFFRVF